MKKSVIALCALLALANCAWAEGGPANLQKVFPVGCEEYRLLTWLFVDAGRALPSSSGPWSADELLRMLDKIDPSTLSPAATEAYERVAASLHAEPAIQQGDGLGMRFGMETALEVYLHTNTDDFANEGDWVSGFGDRKALVKGVFETWPAGLFYGYFELPIGLNSGNISAGVNNLYGPGLAFNLPWSMDLLRNVDLNFPYRAFFSAGGAHWNFQAGRDRLSWGLGETGNLVLGDQLRYHQFLRFATYFDSYKYTTVASFFPHPSNTSTNQNDPVEGFKMFFAHRLEFRFLEDRLAFTINESIMYQSPTGTLDIRVLNPLGFFHNYYLRANANSLLAFELDWTCLPGLNVYGQFVADDFPFLEPVQPDAGANPNAFGFLAGVKGARPLGEGFVYYGIEAAYTDPFFYLREKYNSSIAGAFGVGYDVSVRVFNEGLQYLHDFIGYEYGNDAIVGNLRAGFTAPGRWSAGLDLFGMLHGVIGMDSIWNSYSGTETVAITPTTANPFDPSETGEVEKTLILGAKGSYTILPRLEVYGNVNYIMVWNKDNAARGLVTDTQVSLGISYSL